MKRWHMESIVSLATSPKLAVPDPQNIYSFPADQLRRQHQEFFLIPYVRKIVVFILQAL